MLNFGPNRPIADWHPRLAFLELEFWPSPARYSPSISGLAGCRASCEELTDDAAVMAGLLEQQPTLELGYINDDDHLQQEATPSSRRAEVPVRQG
ncbi:MAG: hypothetical protein ACREMA_02120 [Longimicrobiales bacterium]